MVFEGLLSRTDELIRRVSQGGVQRGARGQRSQGDALNRQNGSGDGSLEEACLPRESESDSDNS